jgi:hypothetical protein
LADLPSVPDNHRKAAMVQLNVDKGPITVQSMASNEQANFCRKWWEAEEHTTVADGTFYYLVLFKLLEERSSAGTTPKRTTT